MKIDWGKLTDDETKEIAINAINYLSDRDLIEILNMAVRKDVREELIAQWEDKQ